MNYLSKTNYLAYRDCVKNTWLKINKPDIYYAHPISSFDKNIIDAGNEIDILARDLFPNGVLVESRDDDVYTKSLLEEKTPIVYQPVFITEKYITALDIFVWDEKNDVYDLYEVKSSTASEGNGGRKTKDYLVDMAFQKNVISELQIPLGKTYLVRLNKEYTREGELSVKNLFLFEDLSSEVDAILEDVKKDMESAYEILHDDREPHGYCDCILRGRNGHCTTSEYSNQGISEYAVHDISRIHKNKLTELIDSNILSIHDVPHDFPLSDIQRRQVDIAQSGRPRIDKNGVKEFLGKITYPIAFLDYETYPSAIPRFDGYKPYKQIPFQFSLHVIESLESEIKHYEFLHTGSDCPDKVFTEALKKYVPGKGSIIVWNEKFEKGINNDLAERLPEYGSLLESINSRVVDLMVPFFGKTSVYDHPGFRGSASIKYVLPALVPDLSYKDLHIQEGGTASDTWNRMALGEYPEKEAKSKARALKEYCKLDTYAMYAIWEELKKLL